MKRLTVLIMFLSFLGFVATPDVSDAIGIYNLPGLTYSPNSDSPPHTGTTTNDVIINQWSSVKIGMDNFNDLYEYSNTASQPMGIYGLAVPLTSYFGVVPGYAVYFDTYLRTWDIESNDTFMLMLTKDNFYWAGGTVVPGGFSWGGTGSGGIEKYDTPYGLRFTNYVDPSSTYFLNVILKTTFDERYVSWGRFSDITVEPIPEPTTMLLLGSGLLGLMGYGRKRFFKK